MRRLFFLLAMLCMLAMPFMTAGKAQAQVSLEIEGHASFALEELSRLADGQGVGGLVDGCLSGPAFEHVQHHRQGWIQSLWHKVGRG